MPRQPTKKQDSTKNKSAVDDLFEIESSVASFSPENGESPKINKTMTMSKSATSASRKRQADESDSVGLDMNKMLESLGADIQKNLIAKKRKMQQLTQASLKLSSKKVEDFLKNQLGERQKLNTEFTQKLTAVLDQWQVDLQKSKEQDEKVQKIFLQQQKLNQQMHSLQCQRIKAIQQLTEQYTKAMGALEAENESCHNLIGEDLKTELALLQKKLLLDTQQREMANVRKSLHTMLF